jgi:hypothetical protein
MITPRNFRLGRRRPLARGPRLRLGNYLMRSLPAAPASVDYWTPAAESWLGLVLANDRLGDCTAAGAFHIGGALLANAGQPIPYTVDDVVKFYSATTGYDPADPSTDQGGDEQTILNYWRETGLLPNAHKITAWASVAPADAQAALWLFENLYFGLGLPDGWLSPEPSGDGFTWDVAGAPDDANGHCFVGLAYDAAGVAIDTWGLRGTLTWAAVQKYFAHGTGGEMYTVLSSDSISAAAQKAPNGFDLYQLRADIDSLL